MSTVSALAKAATKGFSFHHSMIRVKDAVKSLAFYQEQLGMSLLCVKKFPQWKFDLYFLTYSDEELPSPESAEANDLLFKYRGACIELTYNYGNEDKEGYVYTNGSEKNAGFGHFCISVPDVYEACERLEKNGVSFKKKPDEGGMKGLAFIYDPDGYQIELTYNYGNEDKEGYVYTNGSEKNAGFGHFCISVPDVYEACERLEKNGVSFKKKPDEGGMKGLAFIYDPDGYQIELIKAE
eukprot:TRINITY_DN8349_c0_g1_i1.p1 TRINITY_DN8349_c0_g1~~TRINITY_DN8349_c0_g1_i1.p1  ORF type:complete len:238 (-),score=61.94 TRINITY_DN8349_c0_g1_i1:202-915(-)